MATLDMVYRGIGTLAKAAASIMTTPRYVSGGGKFTGSGMAQTQTVYRGNHDMAVATQVPFSTDGRAMYTDGDAGRALREGFTASHYVYLCVRLLARELSRPDWFLERRGGSDGRSWEPMVDTDFEDLMKRPNEFMSGTRMFKRFVQHLYLTGNGVLLKVRGTGNKVKELWPVPPDQIKPVPSRKNYLAAYEYQAPGSGPVLIDPDDIIHVMIEDPANPFWGISPLKAMSRLIDAESDALTWWKWSIRNRAAKDGFIKYKRLLSPKEYDKIKSRLYEQVVGPWNSRLPMILTGDADFVPSSQTPVEMDLVNFRKMTREEICIVYGVDPILIGIADKATYSNKGEARLTLWQDNLLGELDDLRGAFDLQLVPDFVPAGQLRKVRTNVDLSRIPALCKHLADLAPAVEIYRDMGWTPNELNVRFGLGFKALPPEIGDRSWMSSSVSKVETPEEEKARMEWEDNANQQQELARMAGQGSLSSDAEKLQALAAPKKEPPPEKPVRMLPPAKGIYLES